jgi:hypothetical protein
LTALPLSTIEMSLTDRGLVDPMVALAAASAAFSRAAFSSKYRSSNALAPARAARSAMTCNSPFCLIHPL